MTDAQFDGACVIIVGINKNGIPILASQQQIKAKVRTVTVIETPKLRKRKVRLSTRPLELKRRRAFPGSDGDPCVYCGKPAENIDHIVPRSKGGSTNLIYNLAPTCRSCNQRKSDKSILMHLSSIVGCPELQSPHAHFCEG